MKMKLSGGAFGWWLLILLLGNIGAAIFIFSGFDPPRPWFKPVEVAAIFEILMFSILAVLLLERLAIIAVRKTNGLHALNQEDKSMSASKVMWLVFLVVGLWTLTFVLFKQQIVGFEGLLILALIAFSVAVIWLVLVRGVRGT